MTRDQKIELRLNCPDCGSETGKRGWVTIPPKSVGSVAMFGRDELCTNRWHDKYDQERAARLKEQREQDARLILRREKKL